MNTSFHLGVNESWMQYMYIMLCLLNVHRNYIIRCLTHRSKLVNSDLRSNQDNQLMMLPILLVDAALRLTTSQGKHMFYTKSTPHVYRGSNLDDENRYSAQQVFVQFRIYWLTKCPTVERFSSYVYKSSTYKFHFSLRVCYSKVDNIKITTHAQHLMTYTAK